MIECCPRLDKKIGRQFIQNEGIIEHACKSIYITEQVPSEQIPDLVHNALKNLKDLEKSNRQIANEI